MSKEQDNKTMAPPTKVEGTIMIPAKQPDDLMLPPEPIGDNKLVEAAGGCKHDMSKKPPEMKVVELKDGGFARIPDSAICETKEEAEKSMMPPPPVFPHGHHPHHHHCKDKHCQDV